MTTDFENLPELTPDQTNVIVAMLGVGGRIIDAANYAEMPLGEFLDHVQSATVQAHLIAAERAARRRARTRLADAAHDAVEVLEHIANDESHDKIERRRAATTILRALAPRLHRKTREHRRAEPDLKHLARVARDLATARTSHEQTLENQEPPAGSREDRPAIPPPLQSAESSPTCTSMVRRAPVPTERAPPNRTSAPSSPSRRPRQMTKFR